MGRTVKVLLANASPDLVHEFRNFGEDVYRALRDDHQVSIDEIDASKDAFHLRDIPKREVRSVATRVRKIAKKYTILEISVEEVSEGDDG